MTRTRFAVLLLLAALFIIGGVVAAQDDDSEEVEAEPTPSRVLTLYSSPNTAQRYNVPVPDFLGWENRSQGEEAFFTHPEVDAEIHIMARSGEDVPANVTDVLSEIIEGFDAEPFVDHMVNLGGTQWRQFLYELDDGRDVTAFGGVRDGNTYVLMYLNADPESDYYMLVTQQSGDDVQMADGIATALDLLGESVSGDPDSQDVVTLSNGDWLRQVYGEGDDALRLLAQQRPGNATYVVMERGDGEPLDIVNKSFFTVYLGFFVTPNNDPFLLLGMVTTALLVGGLIASMLWRYQSLRKDQALIKQLQEEE